MDENISLNTPLTVEEKRAQLSQFFSEHYNLFTKLATSVHIKKLGITDDKDRHLDLFHDLYLHVVEAEGKRLDRYHDLLIAGDLLEYIKRAIYVNCTSKTSQFLGKELRFNRDNIIFDFTQSSDEDDDDSFIDPLLIFDPEKEDLIRELKIKEEDRINLIMDLLKVEQVVEWQNAQIFLEYVTDPGMSMNKLGKKYDLSTTMIFAIIDKTRGIIIKLLKANGLYDLENRKGR